MPMQYEVSSLPSLRELQHEMLNAVLGKPNGAGGLLRSGAVSGSRRLEVYRHTVRVNFLGSVESTYPVILRLVGADYFRQAVGRFQQQHPSRSGDLAAAGAGFASYLTHSVGAEFAYLAEVARLEWAVQESALAGDAAALDLQRLHSVPVSGYDLLRFRLHPSVRLFASRYPCVDIWRANVDLGREPPIMSLDDAPCTVAIVRTQGQLEFHSLGDGELRLLNAFADARSFAAAVEDASSDATFDASAAVQRFVSTQIVVDFT